MKIFQKTKFGNKREIILFGKHFTYTKKEKLPPHIDKEKLLPLIKQFTGLGLSETPHSPRLIVSLTSFPERISEIHFTLYSLLNQKEKPDAVILWLAEEQFPGKWEDLPAEVLALEKNGLTIRWCDDLRSYKKIIPALENYPDDIIIIADDDVFYPDDWLLKLYQAHLKTPQAVIGHRLHRIRLNKRGRPRPYKKWSKNVTRTTPSFRNFVTGCGGCLYPPHSLHPDVIKREVFQDIAPHADDIWLWAMAVLNNVKIRTFWTRHRKVLLVNPEREMRTTKELTLTKLNIAKDGNNRQMTNMITFYPELLQKLKEK